MSVRLISVTPNAEEQILKIARVSSDDSKTDTGLLDYLIRNGHWSPFEMAHAVLEFKTTRAIAAQVLRHRSFSFQEFSLRYAKGEHAVAIPGRRQAEKNRQSSVDDLSEDAQDWWMESQTELYDAAYALYEKALADGIAKESARFVLPLATPTRMYVSGTIRSWIHYLQMRCDEHTQLEHRVLALRARTGLAEYFPVTWEALGWR